MQTPASDRSHMQRALELARRGLGHVEPNPMVGCVIVQSDTLVGEGWHAAWGGDHAEVAALRSAGAAARGATMLVTLEPCCHHGKTPPCTDAIIQSGIARVVCAQRDPDPRVAGGGIAQLRSHGIQVDAGLLGREAERLNAPYLKRLRRQRPWIIAKWAMTLDGKIATVKQDSQWISSAESRARVHQLRGRMDAIMVGSGTANADDPMLTARPAGPRVATRVVVDSQASLSLNSKLVQTVDAAPVWVAVSDSADAQRCRRLAQAGCRIVTCDGDDHLARLDQLLVHLARESLTNVLVEGGGGLLGNLQALNQIDEVHAFLAPKFVGGQGATTPIAGAGCERMADASELEDVVIEASGVDVYLRGLVRRDSIGNDEQVDFSD